MRGGSNGAAGVSAGTSGLVRADTKTRKSGTQKGYATSLRISGPPRSPREAAEAKTAIRDGIDLLRAEGHPAASLQAVVWRLLQDAAETHSRINDPERRWRRELVTAWPPVLHTAQEQFESEIFRISHLKEDKRDTRLPCLGLADPRAESRMMTVLSWLRYVQARTPYLLKRDKLVTLALAGGLGPKRARIIFFPPDTSDSAVNMVKRKVIWHITRELQPIAY